MSKRKEHRILNNTEHKCCGKCDNWLELDCFGKCKSKWDDLRNECKGCRKIYEEVNKEKKALKNKIYHQANKEKINTKVRQYQQANKQKVAEYIKKYQQTNKGKITEYKKQYQQKNREKLAKNKKEYRQDNKYILAKKKKEYYQKNKKELAKKLKKYRQKNKEKINKYHQQRKKTDISYKLACNLRTRLYQALKANYKAGSAVRDLGCSVAELKLHLESLFQAGMDWNNWSKYGWHIDHVKPLSKFDLTDREELLKACHYSNLQPLWAVDNIKKSNKII